MESPTLDRRGFLGKIAAVFGGLAAIPALTSPAFGRSKVRFGFPGYGYGYGFRPQSSLRRFYRSSGRRFYGGGGYGYPPYYGGGYGGYGGGYYRPYVQPYAPAPVPYYNPYYGAPRGIYLRLNGPARRPVRDALALLEA